MAAVSFGLSPALVERMVRDNDHNKYTTLYHLLIRRRERGDLVIEKKKVPEKPIIEKKEPAVERKKDLLIQIEDVQVKKKTSTKSRESSGSKKKVRNRFPDLVSP